VTPEERLDAGLAALAEPVERVARGRLLTYLDLLARWNRTYNLTSVRDPGEMVTRHLLDSLSILPWLVGERALDVGTGAGLPGLVLAAARASRHWVVLDSNGKKTRFCLQAVAELGLQNVQVVRARVESYEDPAGFPCIVSRAFASLDGFVAGARHLLSPGGVLLAMKGRRPTADELGSLPQVGQTQVIALEVPGLAEERHLVRLLPGPAGA
jgi:16S rRNA (guanine527-N7)-methyltransferase